MRRLFAALSALIILTAAPAWADGLSAERVRALVASGEILALEDILKRNEGRFEGRIIEIEIEQKRGGFVYEIKVLRTDGHYRELKIDARTGALLQEE